MKVITTTRSSRPQSVPLVSDSPTIHSSDSQAVTVSVPFMIGNKDMFITFSEQELRDMLKAIEDNQEASDVLLKQLKGGTPNNSGSLV